MKRVFSLVLLSIMLLLTVTACAAEPRDSNYFNSYGTTLSKLGDGDIKITFSCAAADNASQLGVSTFSVYRSDDSGWTRVSGPNSGSYGYGVGSYSFSRNFNGTAGEKYRVEATFLCTIGGTTETKEYRSSSITAN